MMEGWRLYGCSVKLGAVGNLGWGEILGEIFEKKVEGDESFGVLVRLYCEVTDFIGLLL